MVIPFRFSKNVDVVLGTVQLKLIEFPFSVAFVAVISGALGAVVSIVKLELIPAFDVFV